MTLCTGINRRNIAIRILVKSLHTVLSLKWLLTSFKATQPNIIEVRGQTDYMYIFMCNEGFYANSKIMPRKKRFKKSREK